LSLPVSRRRFLLAAAATATAGAAGVAGYAALVAPNALDITEHGLPSAATGAAVVTIAQVSDLHARAIDRRVERVAQAVARLAPDIILLTGDVIDRRWTIPVLEDFLRLLPASAAKIAISGNWERWCDFDQRRLEPVYERHGAQLLVNRSVVIEQRGRRILFTGLDDLRGGVPDLQAALRGVDPEDSHLLLAHCPAQRDDLAPSRSPDSARTSTWPESLGVHRPIAMLSGHTHGGQVRPLGITLWTPPGSGRYVSGWYRDGSIPLYVSRGLGSTGIPVRLNATPEIALFRI